MWKPGGPLRLDAVAIMSERLWRQIGKGLLTASRHIERTAPS
jgi:hypothetical protein